MSDNHDHPEEQSSPPPFDGEVYPGLLPVQWRAVQVTLGEDGPDPILAVMLELRTPAGIHITFWPENSALALAEKLFDQGEPTSRGEVAPQPLGADVPPEDG